MAEKLSLGFDLGGTKMFAVVLDADYKEVASARNPTEGYDGAAVGMKRVLATIDEALAKAKLEREDIGAIGIGCPGVVDFESGVLRIAPNLGWVEVEVGKILGEAFRCPVAVLNDVDAGTFGEYIQGAGQGARSLLGVFPGTGVGGGFIYEGRILRGKRASCMEIGNIRLLGSSLEGATGEPVSLEALASRLSIASACTVEAYRGRAPYILENAGTDLRKIKSGTIKKAIAADNTAVRDIMCRSIEYLGIGISAAVDLLGPDVVVVGGGLAEKMPQMYLDQLHEAISMNASNELTEDLEIRIAKLEDHAVVIGAAAYAVSEGRG
jgi:glucokinase